MGCPLFLCQYGLIYSLYSLLDSTMYKALIMDRVGLAYDFFDI